MSKINVYEVQALNHVNPENYKNGDMFITNRSIGFLINGQIKTVETNTPNLKDYVKKEEVQKMIQKEVKKNG